MSDRLNCFILAAGFGERLRPITNHIPKPLLPVLGQPVLELLIRKMLALDVNKIGINVHYKKQLIQEWISCSEYKNIVLFPEDPILDTGGALRNAAALLAGSDFIVHNGDIVSDIELSSLIEYHRTTKNLATLAVHHYPKFNHVALDAKGFLKGVGKSCGVSSGRLVAFTGIAAYSPEFLKFLPSGASSVVDAWLSAAAAGYRVGTFDVSGCSWSDIGSPSAYASAVIGRLRNEGESVHIAVSTQGCSNLSLDGVVVIENGCTLGNSSLKNCIVLPGGTAKDGVYENCIIGSEYTVAVDESAFTPVTEKGTLIGTGGSDRKYFRRKINGGTVVAMECSADDPDFSRHVEYTIFFRKYGIPVPEMFETDMNEKSALFEDLGDLSLYSWMKCPRSDEETEEMYRMIMNVLVQLHCKASEHVSECPGLAGRIFDYDYLRWETNYFIERFVKGLKAISIDTPDLNDELNRLALKTDAFPKRIIHRDFQSQNIMISKGVPRIIDFQGARMAPSAYDLASVLFDPYAALKDEMREGLLSYYIGKMSEKSGAWFKTGEFRESLVYCRLQRHMQALGAYGFLSIVKGKRYFLKHVPHGLRLLKEDVELVRDDYPALYKLIASLS